MTNSHQNPNPSPFDNPLKDIDAKNGFTWSAIWGQPLAICVLHALNYVLTLYIGFSLGKAAYGTSALPGRWLGILLIFGFLAECLLTTCNMRRAKPVFGSEQNGAAS